MPQNKAMSNEQLLMADKELEQIIHFWCISAGLVEISLLETNGSVANQKMLKLIWYGGSAALTLACSFQLIVGPTPV
jgi:hypothetical protein